MTIVTEALAFKKVFTLKAMKEREFFWFKIYFIRHTWHDQYFLIASFLPDAYIIHLLTFLVQPDYIETLPLANTPEVFGLHPNAEIGYYTQAARDMWSHMVELQPQTGETGAGISRDEFIDKVCYLQYCW